MTKKLGSMKPVPRLALARTLTGERVIVSYGRYGGRKAFGVVLGCGPAPWGGGADCIVLEDRQQSGYLSIISLAEVEHIACPRSGEVLTGNGWLPADEYGEPRE